MMLPANNDHPPAAHAQVHICCLSLKAQTPLNTMQKLCKTMPSPQKFDILGILTLNPFSMCCK